MTNEDLKAIQDIQGTAGFRVIRFLIQEKINKLESVMGINRDGLIAEQALGRQLAYETLTEFLNELQIFPTNKEVRRTYE